MSPRDRLDAERHRAKIPNSKGFCRASGLDEQIVLRLHLKAVGLVISKGARVDGHRAHTVPVFAALNAKLRTVVRRIAVVTKRIVSAVTYVRVMNLPSGAERAVASIQPERGKNDHFSTLSAKPSHFLGATCIQIHSASPSIYK